MFKVKNIQKTIRLEVYQGIHKFKADRKMFVEKF